MATASARAADTVVLLHGLGRTHWSMTPLARALEQDGYRVLNLSYPSRTLSVESLANDWLPQQLEQGGVASSPRVHFVTHSLGGIMLRVWLRDHPAPANLGRVVMLAPPNSGSEVSDRLNGFPPFRWFTGATGKRLGTAADSLPRTLGPWPLQTGAAAGVPSEALAKEGELGIIAGDRSLNPLLSAWLPGPDDGKVTVASTHLAGEHAHVVLHHSHTWLGWRSDTIAHVRTFLRSAKFGL